MYPEYYIIKVNKFDDIAKNTLDEWIDFLKNERVKEGLTAKGLPGAKEQLDKLKLSKEAMMEYERDMKNPSYNLSGMESYFLAGEWKGEANKEKYADEKVKEKAIEMAINCLGNGMYLELAPKLTGLTEDEIKHLKG